ncbi:MAG TPA: OmpA family protein [Blastocatellia bacterium]|nr:OmpA family protein [Blastocatellia bacterium]
MSEPSVHHVAERMEPPSTQPHQVNGAEAEPDSSATQLRELQKLLFDTEHRTEFEQLRSQWDDPEQFTPRVSQVLPDAIAQRSSEDHQLTEAIAPYVVESIKVSARRNPDQISDAIFPILGPAIRKAIAQAFNNLTITINQTLQHSFSARGLKWRMEAMASGKSFAEVVMYHSLLYRVEQVLLIHRPSGIVLLHAVADTVKAQDPELVSGMLTAIQDFIQDSFGTGEGGTSSFVSDELTILTEPGPRAFLACVVRGTPPPELQEEMQETIERIHRERGEKLRMFEGDATPFEVCRPFLEEHLKSRYQPFAEPGQQAAPRAALVAVGLLLIALGLYGLMSLRDRWRWNAYLERLQATPGIVVTEEDRTWRGYQLAGLRDPLALDPAQLMTEFHLDPARLTTQLKEYQAPELAEARAKKLLAPPPSVALNVKDGILFVTGSVSQQWISESKKLAPFIPGISQLQWDNTNEAHELQRKIEGQFIQFAVNEIRPMPGQDEVIALLVQNLTRLDELAQQGEKSVVVSIIGHTDLSGTSEKNRVLSQQRASQIKALLETRTGSLKRTRFVVGEERDQEMTASNAETSRRVIFKIAMGS